MTIDELIKVPHKKRILLVEDERLTAEDLTQRLEEFGLEVIGVASTGTAAIKLAAENNPDLILMDIKLRGKLSGIDAAIKIHENHAVPIVFATAYGDNSHITRAVQEANAYGFLHKPIDTQAANTMIRIALTRFATDQMMLRINDLLSMKGSISKGLETARNIEEIGKLLFEAFSGTQIFEKFWIMIWSEDGQVATSHSKGIDKQVFATYLKQQDRSYLENQKMMIPDDLMNTLSDEDSFLILIRGEEKVVGLVGFTWNMSIPNFRNEFSVVKDVAMMISQRIEHTQLKDEHAKAHRQVAESAAHIKAIVEQSATGIYIIDEEANFVYVNDRLCEIFDCSRETLLGSNLSQYLGPSRLKIDLTELAQKAEHHSPREFAMDIMRPNGEIRDILISTNSFKDSEGEHRNVGHALDVTDQNLANLELKKLSQAVEQSPVMTVITDVVGTIQYVNRQFIHRMGYSLEELIGSNPRMYKSDLHDDAFYKDMWDTIKNGYVWTGEVVNKKKDGDLAWGKVSISPIRNAYGIVTHFVALTEDISRQKDEELRSQRDQKLRDVLYAITSAAIKATSVSKLYDKIYQFISEIISSSNFFLAIYNQQSNTITFPYERDTYDEGMPESIPCDPSTSLTARTIVEKRTLHFGTDEIKELSKEGKLITTGEIPSVWLGIPLVVKEEVIGALVLQEYDGMTHYDEEDVRLLDLTAGQVALTIDRARKAKALKELADELASANGMKELLLDVITHDLRNPAGVISSLAEMLSADDDSNEIFEVLHGSAESLMKVIENATVLSKLSIGENISKSDIDLVSMLNKMEAEFSSQLSMRSMTLKSNLPEALTVSANPIISEIPKNYISNAIKYGVEGSTIKIVLKQEHDSTTLEVQDAGAPIPEELRDTIFQRNVQLAKGPKQGRGLGLAIVKRIADAHEAEVGVTESPEGGNSFYLKF